MRNHPPERLRSAGKVFCGIPFTDDTLYATVLAMEQIMSTGGGLLQVILRKGVTKENVHKRLKDVFRTLPWMSGHARLGVRNHIISIGKKL